VRFADFARAAHHTGCIRSRVAHMGVVVFDCSCSDDFSRITCRPFCSMDNRVSDDLLAALPRVRGEAMVLSIYSGIRIVSLKSGVTRRLESTSLTKTRMDNLENVNFQDAPKDKLPRCPHCEAFLSYNEWKRW